MYKVFTPARVIETDYKGAIEYQRLYGYPFQNCPEEFDLEEVFGEQTDCNGMCFSDADPGL